jgi:DNA topoisomerase-1
MSRRVPWNSDRGSAALLLIGVLAALALSLALIGAAGAMWQRVDLQHKVDSLALAGADTLSGRLPGYPCEVVATLAKSQGVVITSCTATGLEMRVQAAAKWGFISLSARAHAGPP